MPGSIFFVKTLFKQPFPQYAVSYQFQISILPKQKGLEFPWDYGGKGLC